MATESEEKLAREVLAETQAYGFPPSVAGPLASSICGPRVGELASHLSHGGTIKGFVRQIADADPQLAAFSAVRRVSRQDMREGRVDPADILGGKVRLGW